jgi:hypothetical protein
MTTTTGNTHAGNPAGQGRTRHVLLRDDQGRLALVRLRPWHRLLARCAAWRLDGELAAGTSPESSIRLAARAMQLTSSKCRRDLATSLERILAAVREQPAALPSRAAAVHPPRLPLCRAQISRSAVPLATLVGHLTAPGPVPVQGVAMVHRLVTNGAGPLYWEACRDDLGDIIEKATRAMTADIPLR